MSDTPRGGQRVYTVPEIAAMLGVNEQTIWRWIRRGDLVAIKLGGTAGYRIEERRLQQFLRARETGSTLSRQLLAGAGVGERDD